MNIKVCSLNVRGLRNKDKREKMFCWLKEQPYNIILLKKLILHMISTISGLMNGVIQHFLVATKVIVKELEF